MTTRPRRAPTGLARTIACVAGALALVDVWQVALRMPGALSLPTLAALLAVYATCAALACLAAVGLVRLVRPARAGAGGPAAPPPAAIAILWALVAVGALGATRGFPQPSDAGRAPSGGGGEPTKGATRPNVLLVVLDALRADHVSCYGYERPTTPELDRLAGRGVRFDRAIAQSSWTKPSVASLLTARHPGTHGATTLRARVPDDEILLAERLREGGYRTAIFSANPWVSPGYGFAQGADDVYVVPSMRGWSTTLAMAALRRVNRLVDPTTAFTARVRDLLRRHPSTTSRDADLLDHALGWLDARRDEPFFLYVHFVSPHAPWDPPAELVRLFDLAPDGPAVFEHPRRPRGLLRTAPALPPAAREDLVARYDASVRFVDGLVGRLVAKVQELGVLDETVVVVTADHGEEFYDHGSWGHGQSLYQELIHVPLIVAHPARLPRAVRVERLVMTVDVAPTILELAGIPVPEDLAGRSLLPLLGGADATWSDEAWAEVVRDGGESHAVLVGDRKLVRTRDGDVERTERFDLAADPLERRSVPRASTDPIDDRLEALRAQAARRARPADGARPNADTTRALRELGYLEGEAGGADAP